MTRSKTPPAELADGVVIDVPDEAGLLDPPEFEAPEFVHRPPEYRLEQLPVDRINVCSQHRNGSNPAQRELDGSIARRGLDNPLTVTVLGRARTEEYIAFTNRVWGSEVDIADFAPRDESGDRFELLVSGHTRLQSCKAHAAELGCSPGNYYEHARVLEELTVDEIVAWQTEENLHSAPMPQNTARLLAEAWLWQKEREADGADTVTRREFAKQHCVGEQALRDALNYVQLPPDVRALTDDRVLPYSVAVEVGRAIKPVRDWAELKDAANAEELCRTELLRLASCYLRKERIQQTRQEIRARVQGYREALGGDDSGQAPLDDFLELVEEPSALDRARALLQSELKEVQGRLQRGHLGLYNSLTRLAEIRGIGIEEGHVAEIVGEGVELLENGELREGETIRVG